MKTVKQAADALLERNEITKEEYAYIEKVGAITIEKSINRNLKSFAESIKRQISGVSGSVGKLKKVQEQAKSPITNPTLKSITEWGPLKTTGEALTFAGEGIKKIWPIAGLFGAGIVGKELVVDPIVRNRAIENSYNTMLSSTPQLAGEDQNTIRSYFDVVKTFSPNAAANPLVAGSLVNKMVQFGGVDHKLVQDMASLEESSAPEGIFSKVLEGTAKTLTGAPKSKD
jgi:hypothetical protein